MEKQTSGRARLQGLLKAEGREWTTRQPAKDAPETSEHGGTGRYATQAEPPVQAAPASVQAGRTVPIAQFEFCRFTNGVRMHVLPEDEARAYEEMRAAVEELNEREKAALARVNRRPEPIRFTVKHWLLQFWLEYGMTVQPKKFETAKFDCGVTETVSDGEDFEVAVKRAQDKLKQRVGAEMNRARSGVNDIEPGSGGY